MLLSEHKDLKLEIKALPVKEKDKLLLRLLAKDKVLTEHLHFKLLENEEDLHHRHDYLIGLIDGDVADMLVNKRLTSKDALLRIRRLNAKITHHFKVTKDVASEIDLKIHLLTNVPIGFNDSTFSPAHKFNEKLFLYVVKSAATLLNKYRKLHDDLQFDLKDAINVILNKIHSHRTANIAKEIGLPEEL
jgi:hypothetical protein